MKLFYYVLKLKLSQKKIIRPEKSGSIICIRRHLNVDVLKQNSSLTSNFTLALSKPSRSLSNLWTAINYQR